VTRGRGVKPDLDRERHAAHVGRCGNRVTSWCRDHDDHDHRPRAGSSGRRRVRGLPRRSRLPLERPDANPSDNSPSTTNPSQNVNDVPRHPCTMSRDITGRSGWDSVNTQVRAHAGSNAVSNRHDQGFWEHRDPGPRGYRPARHLSYPDLAGITPCIPARRRSRRFVPRGAARGGFYESSSESSERISCHSSQSPNHRGRAMSSSTEGSASREVWSKSTLALTATASRPGRRPCRAGRCPRSRVAEHVHRPVIDDP